MNITDEQKEKLAMILLKVSPEWREEIDHLKDVRMTDPCYMADNDNFEGTDVDTFLDILEMKEELLDKKMLYQSRDYLIAAGVYVEISDEELENIEVFSTSGRSMTKHNFIKDKKKYIYAN